MSKLFKIKTKAQDEKEISNDFYKCDDSKGLVVLFPGVNYSCDKPLLHYARKIAILNSFDVLCIEYSKKLTKHDVENGNLEFLQKEILMTLKEVKYKAYNKIYFISKSIGTKIAGELGEALGDKKIKQLYLTPLKGTIRYMKDIKCTAITGTKDKFFKSGDIDRIKEESNVNFILIEEANHSLEIEDDISGSIKILNKVSEEIIKFLSE